jgi:nucleotide-binding universal stress UspA family protein
LTANLPKSGEHHDCTCNGPPASSPNQNIAVLTDLGGETQVELRFAASLAQWYGAKLMVAHACSPDSTAPPTRPDDHAHSKEQIKQKIRSSVQKAGIAQAMVSNILVSSSLGDIFEQVELRQPDLLIVATHGRKRLDKWFNGSVAEEIFRKAQCPVLVLPPAFQSGATGSGQLQRVLLATDLSGISAKAFSYANGIAQDHGAQIVALYVDADGTAYSFERLIAMQLLEDWLRRKSVIHGGAQQPERIVRFGKPSEEIAQVACDYKTELIVLGARSLKAVSGLASHVVAGTAYEVMCSSTCPVLIVPDAD